MLQSVPCGVRLSGMRSEVRGGITMVDAMVYAFSGFSTVE